MNFEELRVRAATAFDQLWPVSHPNPPLPEVRSLICDYMAAFAWRELMRETIKQAQADVGKPHGGPLA